MWKKCQKIVLWCIHFLEMRKFQNVTEMSLTSKKNTQMPLISTECPRISVRLGRPCFLSADIPEYLHGEDKMFFVLTNLVLPYNLLNDKELFTKFIDF